jgi:hypothetical protein
MKVTFFSKDMGLEYEVEEIWPARNQFSIRVDGQLTVLDGADSLVIHTKERDKLYDVLEMVSRTSSQVIGGQP